MPDIIMMIWVFNSIFGRFNCQYRSNAKSHMWQKPGLLRLVNFCVSGFHNIG